MSEGVEGKSGFQSEPEKLVDVPPKKLVQMNSLQPADLKIWVIEEAKDRGVTISQLVRRCLTIVRRNPTLFTIPLDR